MNKLLLLIISTIILLSTLNLASSVVINSVDVDELLPGAQGKVSIEVKNIFNDDVSDVSLSLDFKNSPFIPIGTSEESVDEIKEDDEENFVFFIKAASDIKPGDYEIPYTLSYITKNDIQKSSTGTIGIRVRAQPELVFTVNAQNNVINKKGKIELKIVNKGFYDARFFSVKIIPEGFTLLSDNEVYIGSVKSDDFETASFDIVFTSLTPTFNAKVEYTDFDNNKITKNIFIPVNVYSEKKAKELGIIQQNYTLYYVIGIIVLIILFFVWRAISKRRKLRRSMRARSERE